jgi:hypothetical protein
MHGARATAVDSGIAKGSWSEIFRNGLGLYSALMIGGIAMNATHVRGDAMVARLVLDDGAIDAGLCRARLLEGPGPARPRGGTQPLRRSAVSPIGNASRRRPVRRGQRIGARGGTARRLDCGSGGACRPDLLARQAGRRQPLSAGRPVVECADWAGAMDSVIARDDADLSDSVPAAAAAGRASGVAGCDQFPQHRHFDRLDHRHFHRFGVVGEA